MKHLGLHRHFRSRARQWQELFVFFGDSQQSGIKQPELKKRIKTGWRFHRADPEFTVPRLMQEVA